MAPPIPPRPSGHHVRTGSARAAFDHSLGTSDKQRRTQGVRARLDSEGSTRGAFFASPEKKKRSPRKPEEQNQSANAMDMASLAKAAMSGGDGLGEYLHDQEGARVSMHSQGDTCAQNQHHLPKSQRQLFSRPKSPIRDIENPKINDVVPTTGNKDSSHSAKVVATNSKDSSISARSSSPAMLSGYNRAGAPQHHVSFKEAAVEIGQSERSLDLFATLPERSISRKESMTMQYSVGSLDDSNNLMGGNSSLHGTNIALSNNGSMPPPPVYPAPAGWGGAYQQPPPPFTGGPYPPTQQQQEIAMFSSMVHAADYGATSAPPPPYGLPPLPHPLQQPPQEQAPPIRLNLSSQESDEFLNDTTQSFSIDEKTTSFVDRCRNCLNPTAWLLSDMEYDEEGLPLPSEHWTPQAFCRHLFYNPEFPEFTSLQQFSWAVILGIAMGMYTAVWKFIIEYCQNFMWQIVPGKLYQWGVFTDLDGRFPLPHYMWICPAIFGGVLSYIFVILPTKIPGQNEWIHSLHIRGVQGHETFWPLFCLSTAGMASGLSLGPELPLVLTAGMVGSWLGVVSNQSMLQARVMNITCASAAVGGFFGFPMAGAMFVLEIPHRMGLQYFEALSPATIASIVAVLVNRMIVNNDVTGYYKYPFLTETLPSHIFTTAVIYGMVGCVVGIGYAEGVMYLKHLVHDLFNTHHDDEHKEGDESTTNMNQSTESKTKGQNGTSADEMIPLVGQADAKLKLHVPESFFERMGKLSNKVLSCGISHEPTRAAVAGTLAGLVVGITCMFVPHVMFWGEQQLQSLIDKGRTPLPVFGEDIKATEDLTAYGYCLIDPLDETAVAAGFSIGCAALITTSKILVTGLSLGTGIIGGHFWGPLFVGCAASHLLTDVATLMQQKLGFGESLATYPCLSILCLMGSTHVVTFRAHMAIMLILTLTISAFDQGNTSTSGGHTAGDYSAVFPLLVVSVFVSLMVSRGTVFYSAQRSRGDIMAMPEVLCEPGKAGMPAMRDYNNEYYEPHDDSHDFGSMTDSEGLEENESTGSSKERRMENDKLSKEDIERDFAKLARASMSRSDSESSIVQRKSSESSMVKIPEPDVPDKKEDVLPQNAPTLTSTLPSIPRPKATVPDGRSKTMVVEHEEHPDISKSMMSAEDFDLPSRRLNEMLSKPVEPRFRPTKGRHRRVYSAPMTGALPTDLASPTVLSSGRKPGHKRTGSIGGLRDPIRERSGSTASSRASTPPKERLVHVNSFGEFTEMQPSLIEQARRRASSMHVRNPSLPRSGRHSRQNSNTSVTSAAAAAAMALAESATLSPDDAERAFSSVTNQQGLKQVISKLNKSIWSSSSGSFD